MCFVACVCHVFRCSSMCLPFSLVVRIFFQGIRAAWYIGHETLVTSKTITSPSVSISFGRSRSPLRAYSVGVFVATTQVNYMLKEQKCNPNDAWTIIGNLKGARFASWQDFVDASNKLKQRQTLKLEDMKQILSLNKNLFCLHGGQALRPKLLAHTSMSCNTTCSART